MRGITHFVVQKMACLNIIIFMSLESIKKRFEICKTITQQFVKYVLPNDMATCYFTHLCMCSRLYNRAHFIETTNFDDSINAIQKMKQNIQTLPIDWML